MTSQHHGAASVAAEDEHVTSWWRRPVWTFTRHYLEMIVAMLVGMAVLYPLWSLLVGSTAISSWASRPDVDSTAMATAMSITMVAWMRFHRARLQLVAEMTLAMYAGFWVLFPLLWAGALGEMGLMMLGHVLMPVFMLVAMLLRRGEYAYGHAHAGAVAGNPA
jgi:hypothetical protein